MDFYFDSAIIVKLYVKEETSPEAIRLAGMHAPPYCLTHWQNLEVKNAIRLKAFRKEITPVEMDQSIAAFDQDILAGRWQRLEYALEAVENKAAQLSELYSATLGCRTLNIIHVAAAIVIGAKEFVTFDIRQGSMASRAGLMVKP